MNTLPTDLMDRGKGFPLIELTTESASEAERAAAAALERHKSGIEATGAHWNRAVL
jgi:hypothetical protein